MKRLSGSIVVLCLASLALDGCKKKPATATVTEPAAPTTEAITVSPAGEGPKPAPLSAAVQRGVESGGVSPDLAVSDVAYEAWFKKYKLDLNDPAMLSADPDGDGFNNSEEFVAGTNPLDPESHPGVHQAMKMKEFTNVSLPFVLRAVEGESAQIERTEGGEKRVETVRSGQTLKNSPYRVAKVQARRAFDKDGNPIDASRVTLENPTSKEKVELVRDLPSRSSESFAVLTSPDGTRTINVRLGDKFSWPDQPNVSYVVKDLRAEQVIVEQEDTQQMWTVRKQ